MKLFFNELSNDDLGIRDQKRITSLKNVRQVIRDYKVTRCYIEHKDYSDLITSIEGLHNAQEVRNFLFAFLTCPYDKGISELEEEGYCNNEWKYGTNGCAGLALAYICDGATLSIDSGLWKRKIIIRKNGEEVCVHNYSNESDIFDDVEWLLNKQPIELCKTNRLVEEKIADMRVRHDHGEDIVRRIGKRMCQCEYVDAIVNSAVYRPRQKSIVYKCTENGIVELHFLWSEQHLGIVVQTTGRNKRETEKIAEILEKYCRTKY